MDINDKDFKWYMISTFSGKEDNVIDALKNKIVAEKMEDFFKDIRIFKMPHLTTKDLEKKSRGEEVMPKMVNIYKGYIFLRMVMTDEAWYLVRNTQYVTGLVGSSGQGAKPTPISNKDFEQMIKKEQKLMEDFNNGIIETIFKEGTLVKIINGPFKDETGLIIKNNDKEQKAFVMIEQFGREVPTEFSHKDLEICS